MRTAIPISVNVLIPADYFERDCRLRECIIEADPDQAVLDFLFGHNSELWVTMLIRVGCDVQIAVDDELRGRAMENAFARSLRR